MEILYAILKSLEYTNMEISEFSKIVFLLFYLNRLFLPKKSVLLKNIFYHNNLFLLKL